MLFLCAVLVFTASMGVSGAAFTASISPQSVGVDYNSSAVAAFTLSTSGSSVNNIEYSFTINGTPYDRTGECTAYIHPFYPVGHQYVTDIPDGGTLGPDNSASPCNSSPVTLTPLTYTQFNYNPYTIVFSATNDSTSPVTETATAFLDIYPTLAFKSLSTLSIPYSDVLRFNVSWVNATGYNSGVPPFDVSVTYGTSSSSCSSDNIPVASANDLTGLSIDTYALTANAPSASGTYYYCASVTDSNYPNGITVSSINPVVANIVTAPTLSIISSSAKVDQGQQINIGFGVYNGIGPFSIAAYSNSIKVSNNATVNTPNTTDSVSFGAPNSPGNYIYILKGVDKETNGGNNGVTYDFSSNSLLITVNPTLSTPIISLSSKNIEQGQPLSASLSWTGGTEPYTANVYVYNATSNALVTGLTGLGISGISSDTANIPIQSNELMPGTYYLKAAVTDSGGTGPETNSSISGNFIIAVGPKITETLSSNSLTYPNYPTINLQVANGISPYSVTINIVNQATRSVVESNSISLTAANNIASYPTNVLATGSYFANVILTDSASPAVTVYSSNAFLISKTPILELDVPSSFTYNGANATVTASVYPLGLTGNLIMAVNGGTGVDVAALTSTSNTLTYNAPASAGSYSFTLATDANSVYNSGTTTANYIISQYNPQPSISVLPSNSFAYDGSNAIINYSLTTYYSNTIGMNLYVNNALVQSSTENLINTGSFPINTKPYYDYYGAAVSQNGTYLYSPSYEYNLISIVNTKTDTIVKTVNSSLLSGPAGIAIPNNTGNAYITNYNNGTLAVFNLSTETVEKDIPLSTNSLMLSSIEPYYIAASPNGKLLYITDGGTDAISVVNTSTNTMAKTVPLRGSAVPYSIVVSQNGNTIYVGDLENTFLYLINTSTYAVKNVSLSKYLTGLGSEMALVGSNLYIPADEGSTGVVIYNTTTGAVSSVSGIPDRMDAVSALDGYIYVSSYASSGVTYVVNVSSRSPIGSIHTNSYDTDYSVTASNSIYLINYEYNITTLKNITIIKNTSAPAEFHFYYTGPAATGIYSLKAVPVLSGNYVTSNTVSTLTISPVPLKALSSIPSNSVYNGTNFTVTEYNSNAMKLGLSATLNGNILANVPSLQSNGITTLGFYAGAESKNGTAYFTTDSNTVYYYPPDSTFGNDIIYLPSGFESYGIAISNATDYAYISQYEGNTIQVFDLATNTLLNSIVLPNSTSEIYYLLLNNNDSILYASNYGTGGVDAINLETNAITPISISSDFDPDYMALSPSGRHLYVSGYYENISVINTTTNTVQYTIPKLGLYHGAQISLSSNGEYLYIPVYEYGYVEIYNTHTRSVVKKTYSYYGKISAVSDSNAYLFSYNPYDDGYGVTILNTTTNTQVFGIQTVPFYEDPSYAFTGKNGTVYLIGRLGYDSKANNYTIVAISQINQESEYPLPSAAGSYALDFQTTNSNYTGIGVANDIYTISKATPNIHLSGMAPSFIYSGNSINATATFSISNTMQPLGGTLTLNGNVIATYAANALGHVQTVPINAISLGNYVLEFETPGDANYTAANVIDDFEISAAPAHSAISVPHSFTYNGSNATITASISPSNAIGNLYMSVDSGNYVKVDSTTYSSNAITFNAPAVAGNYSFEFYNTANVLYGEGFSIGNYSIYKATPTMSFPQSCSSYTVDGLSCNTIASIDTYNSQITARLYVTGTLVGSTSNTITYTGSNSIGLYTYTFNETGNANYSADSISYSYDVHTPTSSGHASSTSTSTVTTTMPYAINSTTTSIITTTVPQRTINVSSSTTAYTGSFMTSARKPYKLDFRNLDMLIVFTNPSANSTKVNLTIVNYTKPLPFFANHIKFKTFILNFTSSGNVTANITTAYGCASKYPIAPYELVNGSLKPILPYTLNPATCTISFSISSDPIIALYSNTTVPTTTVSTTAPTTTVPVTPKPSTSSKDLIVIVMVLIAAAIVLFFAYTRTRKQKGR